MKKIFLTTFVIFLTTATHAHQVFKLSEEKTGTRYTLSSSSDYPLGFHGIGYEKLLFNMILNSYTAKERIDLFYCRIQKAGVQDWDTISEMTCRLKHKQGQEVRVRYHSRDYTHAPTDYTSIDTITINGRTFFLD